MMNKKELRYIEIIHVEQTKNRNRKLYSKDRVLRKIIPLINSEEGIFHNNLHNNFLVR